MTLLLSDSFEIIRLGRHIKRTVWELCFIAWEFVCRVTNKMTANWIIYILTCARTHTRTRRETHSHICLCTCTYIMSLCTYVFWYICACEWMRKYECVYACACVRLYVYMDVYQCPIWWFFVDFFRKIINTCFFTG